MKLHKDPPERNMNLALRHVCACWVYNEVPDA